MQVCLKGHVINNSYKEYPDNNKDYCDECGSETITECPSCGASVPGKKHVPNVIAGGPTEPPNFCDSCGSGFPWTNKTAVADGERKTDCVALLKDILPRFHRVVKFLRHRYDDRDTLDVNDEYEVQDLMRGMLSLHFDDIRPEEPAPSDAGKSSRIDFLLMDGQVGIETKMTRKGLGEEELGDELTIDIQSYRSHPNCDTPFCFIYDPDERVLNPMGLKNDLEEQSGDLNVVVIVTPTSI